MCKDKAITSAPMHSPKCMWSVLQTSEWVIFRLKLQVNANELQQHRKAIYLLAGYNSFFIFVVLPGIAETVVPLKLS